MKKEIMGTSGTVKIAAVVFVFICFISACKKDGHENMPPAQHGCRVAYFTTNVRDTSFIRYNSNGSINNIRETNGTVTSYSYAGNMVTLNKTGPTGFEFRTIVAVNSIGLATNVRMEFNSQGTNWINVAYEYNNDQVSRDIVTLSNPGIVDTGNFTWQNGNPVALSDGSTISHYDFDLNSSHQPGDYFSLLQLLTGFEVVRPKNLVISLDQTTFSYVFSADGHISSITETPPNADAITNGFVYECY
jgi:hypothetical protein